MNFYKLGLIGMTTISLFVWLGVNSQFFAQDPGSPPRGGGGPPPFPFPGPSRERLLLVTKFDTDKDQWLNSNERKEARAYAVKQPARGRMGPPGGFPGGWNPFGPGGPLGPPNSGKGGSGKEGFGGGGPPPGFGPPGMHPLEPASAGAQVSKESVTSYPNEPLYSDQVIRTLFLDFESDDWESELSDFHQTDVDVPANLTVDGKRLSDVGVRFRGMSSYMMVGAGHKRSLNISIDHHDKEQRWLGRKTLNLLNAHEDPTYMHTVLYLEAARRYIPAPQANFVHVVINGESWGLYTNAEQFDNEFIKQHFQSEGGTRWKVPGSPMGRGGLQYIGNNLEEYRKIYEIKGKNQEQAWSGLVELCRVLSETPIEVLPSKIEPILDVDGVLRFLALEVALVNSDGYWTRASDYALYLDEKGVFHVIPHDANETFQPPMGPAMFGGFGGGGPGRGNRREGGPEKDSPNQNPEAERTGRPPANASRLGSQPDPFVGLNDSTKPLRSKLLSVPEYRHKYAGYLRDIANEILDWQRLEPRAKHYYDLIEPIIKHDTKKLSSYDAFQKSVSLKNSESNREKSLEEKNDLDGQATKNPAEKATSPPRPPRRPEPSLKEFVDARRAALLDHPEIGSVTDEKLTK